ncbi:hypothetical protein BHUM_06219 [Candidatus Burkholderia humilis]|nr:hypothetical protein BHUM_06219 [Candidatus Burkholderia humilis]
MLQMWQNSLIDDAHAHYPDPSDQLVTNAIRAWFRPHCDAVRGKQNWQDLLCDTGSTRDGLRVFESLMSEWVRTAGRQLDVRCRCSQKLAGDEVSLLQAIACFQTHDALAANKLLRTCFAATCIDRLSSIAHGFAMTLTDTGVIVRHRTRHATYFH